MVLTFVHVSYWIHKTHCVKWYDTQQSLVSYFCPTCFINSVRKSLHLWNITVSLIKIMFSKFLFEHFKLLMIFLPFLAFSITEILIAFQSTHHMKRTFQLWDEMIWKWEWWMMAVFARSINPTIIFNLLTQDFFIDLKFTWGILR